MPKDPPADPASGTAPDAPAACPVATCPLARHLDITSIDPHFAPGPEQLAAQYDINGLSGEEVKLVITADNGGGTVFERPLTAPEKADGTAKTIQWDGTVTAGPRNGRHATPLMGPFKLELIAAGGEKDEEPFTILYAEIRVAWGLHTPDGATPPTANAVEYAQARLDELGYDAGPVTGASNPVTERALRRFQRSHYRHGTQVLLAENGNADADTVTALQHAAALARWEAGKDPLTEDAKLYVDDNYFNDRGVDFVTGALGEFNSMDRKTHVEDELERPYLPLEVEILLLGKGGGAVSAPDAVGDVTVAFEVNDGPEDASVIPAATNATARTYVERARQVGTGASASGPRIDDSGDNALDSLDGFRPTAAADYIKVWFPDAADSKLEPWTVRGYDTETRASTTFHRALVNAWDHPSDHPPRKGRAGAYFRHSTKGGDDAKVRVALTFKGRPNEATLNTDHTAQAANLVKELGRWTVWRRAKLNAYCQQAAPTRASGSPSWATITDWWKEAFIEMDNGGNPGETLDYATVMPQATYETTIVGMPATHRPAGVNTAADLTYRASCVYGGPAIAQGPGETAIDYVRRASAAMAAWCEHPINAILGQIHAHVRQTAPEGLIVYDFRVHDPISGQDWDAAAAGGAGGWVATTNPAARNFTAGISGYVRLDGAVTMNVDNPFNVSCYLLHECGHARFLYHHKTGGGGAANASDNPAHHDADQERCAMSYGIGADTPDGWFYPFCGKCILRLRGWKVTTLPNQYTA